MTGNSTLFSTYKPSAGNKKVKIANGSFSAIAGNGNIIPSPSLPLNKVLHVPNLSCNIFSISKITKDLKCRAIFESSHCVFQDLESSDGLYILDEGTDSHKGQEKTCLQIVSCPSNKDIYLMHFRLGHPSFY